MEKKKEALGKHPEAAENQKKSDVIPSGGKDAAYQALQRSGRIFFAAQRIAHFGDWVWDINTNSQSWSDELYRIYGLEPQKREASYKLLQQSIHPDDRESVTAALSQAIDKREAFSIHHRIVRPDRSERIVHEQGEVICDADGKSCQLVAVVYDITEQRKAELHNQHLGRVLEGSLNEIYFFDAETLKFTMVNYGARKNLGYTMDELRNLTPLDIKPKFTPESFAEKMVPLRNGRKELVSFDTVHQRKDGGTYPIELRVHLSRIEAKPIFIAIGLDITERKRSEEALKNAHDELEKRVKERTAELDKANQVLKQEIAEREKKESQVRTLSMAVEQSPAFIIITDTQGNIEYVNSKFSEITQYSIEEVIGQNPRILQSGHHPLKFFKTLWQTISADKEWHAEVLNRKKKGELFWQAVSISPVHNPQGKITHYVSVQEDISERKKKERELQQARIAAEEANRAKSAFLANMSHEIRTPMNAILGFSQLMLREPTLTEEQKANLMIITRSGENLLALINDILDMSKIEAGRMTLDLQSFDLNALISDMETMFRVRTDAKNLQLLVSRMGELPRYIRADEGKLRQILINLLGNAVKFTDSGGIALRLGVKQDESGTMRLMAEVEDSGIGIEKDEIDKLFHHFEQTTSGKRRQGGTGLGLALCNAYTAMMGGDISVTSQVGKGTVFCFNIKIEKSGDPPTETLNIRRRVKRLMPGQPKFRILVVDDRETNRQVLLKLLTLVGFEVLEAGTGKEAVEVFNQWKPSLVLMDMVMPVMDGYQATKRIKSTELGKRTVVIAVTASAFQENQQGIQECGADDFMGKPFRESELFEIIQKHLAVEYLYEEEEAGKASGEEAMDPVLLTKEALLKIPRELLRQMYQATNEADLDGLNKLIDQAGFFDASAVRVLRELANNFAYDALISLFQNGEMGYE